MNVPDLMLERYRLGELPPADAERLARLLAADEGLRRRLDAIERSDREFADGTAARLGQGVNERLRQPAVDEARSGLVQRWGITALVTVTLFVALIMFPAGFGWWDQDTDCCADRPKGPAATLTIYRSTGAGSKMLADNDVAHAGDVVRVGYRAADRGFGAIVSVDGRGALTWHLPVDAGRAAPIEPGRLVLLDASFELDDAPRVERFYFITASSPFELPEVAAAVRRASAGIARGDSPPLALPDRFNHAVFSLRKEPRP